MRVCDKLGVPLQQVIEEGPVARHSVTSRVESPIVTIPSAPVKPSGSVEIFVAAPMASMAGGYESHNAKMLRLVADIERHIALTPVYYAGTALASSADFEDEAHALRVNFAALTAARRFLLIYPEPLPTSALIELGYAMALELPIRVFIRDWGHLPFMLRSVTRVRREVAILRCRSLADVVALLQEETDFLHASGPAT